MSTSVLGMKTMATSHEMRKHLEENFRVYSYCKSFMLSLSSSAAQSIDIKQSKSNRQVLTVQGSTTVVTCGLQFLKHTLAKITPHG